MKRYSHLFRLLLIPAVMLLAGLFALAHAPVTVLAEESEDVQIELTADPAALSASEPVTLTFTVSNYSEYELHDVAISHGATSYAVEGMEDNVIPPGGTGIYPLTIEYPDSWIGLPVEFTVSYLKYAEPYAHTLTLTVERTEEPVIGLTRTVSTAQARAGEAVTVTYELINDTKFDMEDITLIDEEVSDNAIFRNHTLYAGSHVTQTCVYTMKNTDVLSAPVITYDVNGKTKTFSAVEPAAIKLVDVRLSLQVETGQPSATGVPFILTVRNPGNIAVENIIVYDDRSQPVTPDIFSLDPGEERALSFNIIPALTEAVRNVTFSAVGVDALGNAYEYTDKNVYPVYPYVDDTQIDVTLRAECVSEWNAVSKTVRVRFTVTNYSDVVLTNARVSEEICGVVGSYGTLNTGNTVFEQEMPLESPRNLTFSVFATDPAGTERLLTAATLTVDRPEEETPVPAEAAVTPEPGTEEAETVPQQKRTLSLSDTILRGLIIVGAVLVVGFVALIVLTVLEQNKTGGILLDLDDDGDEAEDLIDMSLVEEDRPRETEKRKAETGTAQVKQTPAQPTASVRERPRGASDYIRIAAERRAGYDAAHATQRPETGPARGIASTGVIPPVNADRPLTRVPERVKPAPPASAPVSAKPGSVPAGEKVPAFMTVFETKPAPLTAHAQAPVAAPAEPAVHVTEAPVTVPLASVTETPVAAATASVAEVEAPPAPLTEAAVMPVSEAPAMEPAVPLTEAPAEPVPPAAETPAEPLEPVPETASARIPSQDVEAPRSVPAAPRRIETEPRAAVRALVPDKPRHIK